MILKGKNVDFYDFANHKHIGGEQGGNVYFRELSTMHIEEIQKGSAGSFQRFIENKFDEMKSDYPAEIIVLKWHQRKETLYNILSADIKWNNLLSDLYPCSIIAGSNIYRGFFTFEESFAEQKGGTVLTGINVQVALTLDSLKKKIEKKQKELSKHYDSSKFYDIEKLIKTIDKNKAKINKAYGNDPSQDCFISVPIKVNDMQIDSYHKTVGSPLSLFINGLVNTKFSGSFNIIKDPNLLGSGIESMVVINDFYQEIEMALNKIVDSTEDVKFDDKVILESKGFDNKTSFRNVKKKGS